MSLFGTKRARPEESTDPSFPGAPDPAPLSTKHATPSSFRNVSACNRCRLRKNRCDQNLPACASCEKAGVKCVGFDPLTKREIPRTYVYYLESRLNYLESLLTDHGIPFAPSQEFDIGSKPSSESAAGRSPPESSIARVSGTFGRPVDERRQPHDAGDSKLDESEKLNKLVSNIGMVSVQGTSDPRFLGSTSGISFARVVFAAVKSSISSTSSERGGLARSNAAVAAVTNVPSMRDSFFGLQSKPAFKPAPFPDKKLALHLVNLYFEHANPQIPILHREDFMAVFEKAYAAKDRQHTPRELYMLNIVFAIGAGIIMDDRLPGRSTDTRSRQSMSPLKRESSSPKPKKHKLSNQQPQPEEYHASAIIHLESFLGSNPTADRPGGFGGGLEELQAVLLLAGFALLRPVAPGLWYISGVAVRLAVDLGLHYEGGADLDENGVSSQPMHRDGETEVTERPSAVPMSGIDERERGRREWVRDLRRRLWWCVYSFDRLVCVCVGRPVGISDAVVTTDFPSILGDEEVTPAGLSEKSAEGFTGPSYKRVAHHYFRLRLLQSEILQVLQYRQAQKAHESKMGHRNQFMHTRLTCSFLQPFESFHAWRRDIDRRLWEWKESAPLQKDTTVSFSVEFLELNYWQAVIMLYRQSLGVPPKLAGEVSPSEDVSSPMSMSIDGDAEDEDEIYLKVAEAGQRVLKLYRQLHRVHLVNYTYLATVHLFMAGMTLQPPLFRLAYEVIGIAFLYAIWHSATVRSRLVRYQGLVMVIQRLLIYQRL